jgi:hypothetical protein
MPTEDGSDIPEDVLARIKAMHSGDLPYFIADLTKLEEVFATNTPLHATDLDFLDSICEAAEASASATFRKLWRR